MFALSVGQEVAQSVGEAMTSALQKVDIGSDLFVSAVNQNGPLILSQDAAP